MAAIAVFGALAYRLLPVSNLPNVDFPTITVNASLPGGDPGTMSSAIASPLERQYRHHAGVRSRSRHRWRGRRSPDGHCRGHAAAAGRHAGAAKLQEGES